MPEDKFAVDYQRVLITMSLLKNVEDSDYTEKHSLRVGRLVKQIGTELGFDIVRINLITRAAYFHDVGKIKLPKNILFKKGKLTDDEYEEIKKHPTYSKEVLLSLGLSQEADIAVQHHERLNGSGYPKGVTSSKIPIESRILAIADVFDAITAERPYRKAHNLKDALLYLYSSSEGLLDRGLFDLRVVNTLHKVLERNKKIKNTLDI